MFRLTWSYLLGATLIVLTLGGCSSGTASGRAEERPAEEVSFTVEIRLLPEADVVDMTRGELPPLPGAVVTVTELGLKGTTNADGEVHFALPLGTTPGFGENEGVFTFDVTDETARFHTTVRRRMTVHEPRFAIHYNSGRDVTMDLIGPRRPQ